MFGRRRRDQNGPTGSSAEARARRAHIDPAIGVGAQVIVRADPGSADEWFGEPSGVVISPGGNEFFAYPATSMGGPTRWTVSFDEPQYTTDGRGPITQASVPSWRLETTPAEPEPGSETTEDDEGRA
jgi:hypothetical protein